LLYNQQNNNLVTPEDIKNNKLAPPAAL